MTAPATETTSASLAAPPVEPVIRLDDVDKTFGEGELAVQALRDATLQIERGQFVVVLGPSGSGKTTLMNLIGGIESTSAGRIVVNGAEVSGLGERALTEYRRTEVGFVFQFFNLIPTLTAQENVTLVGELVGVGEADAAHTLEEVGLADKADRFPSLLSGGEQQRVQIVRLDRPAGDAQLRHREDG